MPNVIGIRFKPITKIYHFEPSQEEDLVLGDPVIVETSRGMELGWVATEQRSIANTEIKGSLKQVLRRATPLDLMQLQDYRTKEGEALQICKEKVADMNLPMKMVAAEYAYDGSRLTFLFCAEQRIDFRALVRALARIFHTRVEMRQIGARDEAKIRDGYGRCGRQLCCSSWLTEFHPVSIKMAKNQNLPLAPTEISGVCGRLLCCLAYEDETYADLRRDMPRVGKYVDTPQGRGRVKGLNILKQTILVELSNGNREEFSADLLSLSAQKEPEKQPPRNDVTAVSSDNTQTEAPVQKKEDENLNKKRPAKRRRRRRRRTNTKSNT